MKSYRKELYFNIPERRGVVNITDRVQEAINDSGVKEGLVLINAMDNTSSVFISDDEKEIHNDFDTLLDEIAPQRPYNRYRHNGFDNNADAYLKRMIVGREAVCAITKGRLDFGTWEQIFYYEFDGRQRKHVLIKIIGE